MPGRTSRSTRLFLVASALPTALGLAGCNEAPQQAPPADQVETFLGEFWNRPLPAQGTPPERFSALEASLAPDSCGTCHADQYRDWSRSLHSRAMGPGVLGQLVNMGPDADAHQDCIRCHAPLKEQADSLMGALKARGRNVGAAPAKIVERRLDEHGLVCASCHLRKHRRYGPPRRDGAGADPGARLPHDGWTSAAAFEDSRFCAACHQFDKDGYALNGKLLENTYEEWKASRHAREGRTCQSCHMPERRHLWRGIHDPEMVKAGVTIAVSPPKLARGGVDATLTVRNTGTGHHFPTYVTPRAVIRGFQEDAAGKTIPGTIKEFVIARQVSPDLSAELFDTRIAADGEARFDYSAPRHPRAKSVVFDVRVEPDAFYTGLYRSLLERGNAGRGKPLIAQALKDSTRSPFTLYHFRQPLP